MRYAAALVPVGGVSMHSTLQQRTTHVLRIQMAASLRQHDVAAESVTHPRDSYQPRRSLRLRSRPDQLFRHEDEADKLANDDGCLDIIQRRLSCHVRARETE